jgi:serine/threonine protein kinase
MKISCPACQHRLGLNDPKPGKYQPKCPKCGERFLLLIPANVGEEPTVERLATAANATLTNATPASPPAASAEATLAAPTASSTTPPTSTKTSTAGARATGAPVDPLATTVDTLASTVRSPSPAPTPSPAPVSSSAPSRPAIPTQGPTTSSKPSTAEQTLAFNAAQNADATLAHAPPTTSPSAPVTSSTTVHGVERASDPAKTMAAEVEQTLAHSTANESGGFSPQVAPRVSSAAATQHDATVMHGPAAATAVDPQGPTGAAQRQLPENIGGYRILKELGHGAMGDVYLARQVSLDRDVALKTIRSQWAKNPAFIARFTREAYAAAQLTHHNIVQIYDLGVDGEFHFFSMEFVRGEALDQIVKREGPLPPRVAAGYVLQAARGLLFAHQVGMVHRDIKPANLMLNDQGLIKVADMGLVKVPLAGNERVPAVDSSGSSGSLSGGSPSRSAMIQSSLSATLTHFAVGTPAYMPPEQADDASSVDHRADIYSLGCTLYALLAGRSPFEGGSIMEILDKHRTQPIALPPEIARKTPAELIALAERMTAKRPEDRYPDLQQVIDTLDRFLNGGSTSESKPFRPEDVDELETGFQEFNSASGKWLRRAATFGGIGIPLALALVALPFSLRFSLGVLLTLATGAVAYTVIAGVRDRTYLFGRIRQWIGSLRWGDWLSFGVGCLLLSLLLLLVMGVVGTLAIVLVAAAAAFAIHEVGDRRLARQRIEAIARLERLLKHRRLAGVDETALRQFVASHAGTDWEEGFEQLFGYEALISARDAWGKDAQGRSRPRFRPWREPIVRWFDARVQAARDARQRKTLARVETQQLVSAGMTPAAAKQQAAAMADGLVQQAAAARAADVEGQTRVLDPRELAELKRRRVKEMLAAARSGATKEQTSTQSSLASLVFWPIKVLLGARLRFLVGCFLLAGCLAWANQNGLLSRSGLDQAKAAAQAAKSGRMLSVLEFAFPTEPNALAWPLVGGWFTSIAPGIAGILLILLSLGRTWKSCLASIAGAGLILLGPALGIPGFNSLGGPEATSLVLGLIVAAVVTLIPVGRK